MSITAHPPLLFGRWSFRQAALVLFFATFLLDVFGTWSVPLLHNDEARFAEASREMRERQDWVVPYFNGAYRFDKPPLIYWCQVPAMALFGETEFAARFHSVLAGAILAVVIFGFGTRLAGIETGFWAAVIFDTSLRVLAQAKGATSDMLLALFVTLAFWAGWELTRDPSDNSKTSPPAWRNGWWWLFYVSLALAFLAKGPAGWMPLFALPLYRWWAKPAGLNRRFRFELGLPLMCGLVAFWAVPAYTRTNGEFLRVGIGDHVITRMTRGYDGQGASNVWLYLLQSPFYIVLVFGSFIGWSTWFPWCFKQLRAGNWGGATGKFLLSGILITFIIFTLGWSRLPHYTFPAFPLIALLFAILWRRAGRSQRTLAKVAVSLTVISLILTVAAMWFFPRVIPGKALARNCAPFLKPDSAFGSVEMDQASLVWYFRQYITGFRQLLKPDEAAGFMAQPGSRFCVMTREVAQDKFPTLPESWRRIDANGEGYYSGTNKTYYLIVLIKP